MDTKNKPGDLNKVRILGIESSCDETAAAVIENGRVMLSNVVATQIAIHQKYGGVFPEVASRQHVRTIYAILDQALEQAHMSLADIDAIAVTRGPGLAGSLVVGLNAAKGLALGRGLPLMGINHLEGHIYSAWVYPQDTPNPPPAPTFPLLALLVSGGHTELNMITDHLHYQRLGATLDDAAGEAFDKVARLIGLPYPGGPSVQKSAVDGNPEAFTFPRSRLEGTWNFSFSGLKTAVLREVRKLEEENRPLPVANLAASFQAAVVDALFTNAMKAAREFGRGRRWCQRQPRPARCLPQSAGIPGAYPAPEPVHRQRCHDRSCRLLSLHSGSPRSARPGCQPHLAAFLVSLLLTETI